MGVDGEDICFRVSNPAELFTGLLLFEVAFKIQFLIFCAICWLCTLSFQIFDSCFWLVAIVHMDR